MCSSLAAALAALSVLAGAAGGLFEAWLRLICCVSRWGEVRGAMESAARQETRLTGRSRKQRA